MEFWQGLFLAGTATFAIPVAIHLLFKMRKRRVVFSSLRFLKESVLRESRRLQLRDLILLLLRCLACILIALAFARPYRIGQALAGPGGEPSEDLAIVLDDSPSMAAQEGTGSRWQAALGKARQLCAACKSGDRVGLIFSSEASRPEIELSGNFAAVLGALKRERPSYRRGDLTQALRTALDLLDTGQNPRRRVVLIGDLQSTQIDRGAWAECARLAASASRPVQILIAGPGERPPGRLANVAITSVRARSDVWIEGHPVRFAVRVENFGDGEVSQLSLRLWSEGKELAKRTLGLGPRGSTELELGAVFSRPGEVSGFVELGAQDVFPDDDRRYFALRLRDSIKAVVVEDRLHERDSFFDQTYYLRMALDPTARGADLPVSGAPGVVPGYVRVVPLAVPGLSAGALREADLIFLAGVTELPPVALAALEDAVREGRGLVLFLGRSDGRISEAFYKGPFWKDGLGLLPAPPGTLTEGNLLEGKYNGLDAFKAGHPIFQPFEGQNERDLRLPQYLRNYRSDPAELKRSGEARPAGEVLASFNDGSPYLVERPFGKGRVLMFTFCPRPERDTDLPVRKAFVPLVHQVVRYLAGVQDSSKRNLLVGETLEFTEAGIGPETSVTLERPAPQSDSLLKNGSDNVTLVTIGTYRAAFKAGPLSAEAFWAANLDPLESALSSEDLAVLNSLFTSNLMTDAALPDPGVKLEAQASDELKAQAPDWRYFLVAAMFCLLLEVLVRDFWK